MSKTPPRAPSSATRTLPRIEPVARHTKFARPTSVILSERAPFILSKGACTWKSLSEAGLPSLLNRFGDTKIEARVNLPDSSVPYDSDDAKFNVTITLAELGRRIASGERCYGPQINIQTFSGFQPAADLGEFLPQGFRLINLWIGSRTKSGLHYDAMDNLFIQVDGAKRVILAAPAHGRALYPYPDTPTKSRIDPENPDVSSFPRLTKVTFLTATLEAGDILFIPRGWWHFLSAPGPSVSLNCWFGKPMTPFEQIQAVTTSAPLSWITIFRDAIRYGFIGRPYTRRLFSTPPIGKTLYDLVLGRVRSQ